MFYMGKRVSNFSHSVNSMTLLKKSSHNTHCKAVELLEGACKLNQILISAGVIYQLLSQTGVLSLGFGMLEVLTLWKRINNR